MQNAGRTLSAMIRRHRCVSFRQKDKETVTTHKARLHMVDAEMLAECCSANNATEQQNVLATTINWESCTGRTLYRRRINDTQKSARAKRQNAAVHWQNGVLLPQNETQQSNGKVWVQQQNAAVQTMPRRTGRIFLALLQNNTQQSNGKKRGCNGRTPQCK
jgi:hypothetical protein